MSVPPAPGRAFRGPPGTTSARRLPPAVAAALFAGFAFVLALLLGLGPGPARAQFEDSAPGGAGTLEVYVSEGCPHCAAARAFLADFAKERPDLRIVVRSLEDDPSAMQDLMRHSMRAGAWPPGVPTFVHRGRVLVGFDGPERSGAALRAFVGRPPGGPVGGPSGDPVGRPVDGRGAVETTLFGTLDVTRLGLPLFTLALGLLDGFNPCAMWLLLFLLSLLVRLHDRRRMTLVAGTFVLVGGAVYYALMAAWLNVFLLIGMSTGVRIVLALLALLVGAVNVKDFFAFRAGVSLSIPEAAKPGLYARLRAVMNAEALPASLLAVAALAVVANFVELLCTAGFPAIYTAVLAQQGLSAPARYAYLALYIVGYIADDALMVAIAVVTLGSRKLTERTGRWLKLVSGAVMLALGAVLLLRPQWLT